MLKQFKTAVLAAIAIVLSATMTSCSNEEDVKNPAEPSVAASGIETTLQDSYSSILNADLSLDTPSRSTKASFDANKRAANIYVKMPAYYDRADIAFVEKAHSVNDLLTVTREVGAQLSFEKTADTDLVISLSEDKAIETLTPLISECKKYLYTKGFSEKDIQEMIKENGVTEADIVPFVMALTEIEDNKNASFQFDGNLDGVIYAVGFEPQNEAKIDWNKAGKCAIKALGFDMFYAIGQSTLKTWGVAAMKRAFTTVAKKLAGPIGVAIMVGEFTGCYFDLW